MRGFGSDNHSGVHPAFLKAIAEANIDHAPAYGTDAWSEKLDKVIEKEFGKDAIAFPVFNGTAANVTALRALLRPYQAVLVTDCSHLNVDECGAPEFMTGAKLIALPSENGKVSLATLKEHLIRRGDQHYSQVRGVSLTQPTELGTCYSVQEIKEIVAWARSEKLFVHIDGSRFANAATKLNLSLKELSTDLGVDILSFGGTKNGLMMGELVIILNPAYAEDFKYIRKQSCQLPSKSRFITAQFLTYFENELWKQIASHSLKMADLLYQKLKTRTRLEIRTQPESNAVFAKIPQPWIKPLRERFFFYVWDEKTFECRLMTSWDTSELDLEQFVQLIEKQEKK
ncbi:MAG: low specificity L-threonine aldolase [Pseudobdellovibrionaceae bacterium]